MITIYHLCCFDYLTLSQYSKFKTISLFLFFWLPPILEQSFLTSCQLKFHLINHIVHCLKVFTWFYLILNSPVILDLLFSRTSFLISVSCQLSLFFCTYNCTTFQTVLVPLHLLWYFCFYIFEDRSYVPLASAPPINSTLYQENQHYLSTVSFLFLAHMLSKCWALGP